MSPIQRIAPGPSTFALMVFLCCIWGFTHAVMKLMAPHISIVMLSGLRSGIAAVLLLLWAAARGITIFKHDGTLWLGIAAGTLFAGEFLFISLGLMHTGASRMVVFLYLAPCLTILGLHWFIPSERFTWAQWLGILFAFAGIVVAFGDGFASARSSLLGDVFGLIAAVLWAATTVLIRATRLSTISAAKVLFYQLAVTAVLLPIASPMLGEPGIVSITPLVILGLIYQSAIVSFASYLAWFWLLTRYLASRISVFSFLTPLFGVVAGVVVLHEPLRPAFLGAVALVGLGIYLVNQTKS